MFPDFFGYMPINPIISPFSYDLVCVCVKSKYVLGLIPSPVHETSPIKAPEMNRSNTKRGSVSWCFIWMGEGMIFKHRHWTWFSSWCSQFIWKNPRTPTSHIWGKAHPGYFTHEATPSGPRSQPISLPYPRSGHLGCRPTASSHYWRSVSPLSAQPGTKLDVSENGNYYLPFYDIPLIHTWTIPCNIPWMYLQYTSI